MNISIDWAWCQTHKHIWRDIIWRELPSLISFHLCLFNRHGQMMLTNAYQFFPWMFLQSPRNAIKSQAIKKNRNRKTKRTINICAPLETIYLFGNLVNDNTIWQMPWKWKKLFPELHQTIYWIVKIMPFFFRKFLISLGFKHLAWGLPSIFLD